MKSNRDQTAVQAIIGVVLTVTAFLIWGLSPVYWKALKAVPSFEILMHRMVWSFFFLLPVLAVRRQWPEFIAVFTSPRLLLIMIATSILVSGNWLLFIWAINQNMILQTSLGYYMCPLINILLGLVFLKEKLRVPQTCAVLLAVVAVVYLTIAGGRFPWISITLALSFGLYGLIRKAAPVSPAVGLAVETLLLSVPALAYLAYLDRTGAAAFLHGGAMLDLLLIGTALLTALPLLFFNAGAKRLTLSTVGFAQYIAPTTTFLLAVFVYHEPMSLARTWTFVLIWLAVAIYSADSVLFYRRLERVSRAKHPG